MNNKQMKLVAHINTVEKLIERAKLREENPFTLERLHKYLQEEYVRETRARECEVERTDKALQNLRERAPGMRNDDISWLDLSKFTWVESPTKHITYGDVPAEVTMERVRNLKYALHPHLRMIPEQIIVNNVTTICVFPDGTKITSRPRADDEFDLETGIAMCIVKYIYGSRQAFRRAVQSAHMQPGKRE